MSGGRGGGCWKTSSSPCRGLRASLAKVQGSSLDWPWEASLGFACNTVGPLGFHGLTLSVCETLEIKCKHFPKDYAYTVKFKQEVWIVKSKTSLPIS